MIHFIKPSLLVILIVLSSIINIPMYIKSVLSKSKILLFKKESLKQETISKSDQQMFQPFLFDLRDRLRFTTEDSFTIDYIASCFLTIKIKRASGNLEILHFLVEDKDFSKLTLFEPPLLSKKERDDLIKKLSAMSMSQLEIAIRTGVSQTTVSMVLKKHNKESV